MKVILDNKLIHGVPLFECYTLENISVSKERMEDALKQKKLLFFNHGFLGSKENFYGLAMDLARLGFFVVSVDAYEHGERMSQSFNNLAQKEKEMRLFDVVTRTGKDIQYLFEHHYAKDYPMYNIMGISLGAMVGFYTTSISNHVNGLVSIIGTPDFEAFVEEKGTDLEFDPEEKAELMSLVKKDNPIHHMDHFESVKLLMLIGETDDVVPNLPCRQLLDTLVDKGINEKVRLLSYDLGHDFNEHMKNDILAWCVENLL